MNAEQAAEFLTLLGSKKVVKGKEGWVMGTCPFASDKHEAGTDNKPSFGIAVGPRRMSFYHCFSCHCKGAVATLPTTLMFQYGIDYKAAAEFVGRSETFVREEADPNEYMVELAPSLNERVLSKFRHVKKDMVIGRGLTLAMAREAELMYDLAENRLLFPVRDHDGRLVGIRGRYLGTTEGTCKYRDYSELSPSGKGAKAFGVWYGENRKLHRDKMLVVVEGEIDSLALLQAGVKNVWAAMGSSLSSLQIKHLRETNLPVVLFFDNDHAGRRAAMTIIREGNIRSLYKVTKYFGQKDPGDLLVVGRVADALRSIDKVEQS